MNNYTVLRASNLEDLVIQVKSALNNGWDLAGGIATIPAREGFTNASYYQAMTRSGP